MGAGRNCVCSTCKRAYYKESEVLVLIAKKISCFCYLFFAVWHVDSERKSSDNLFVVLGSSRGLLDHLIEKKLLCYAGTSPVIVCARAKKNCL